VQTPSLQLSATLHRGLLIVHCSACMAVHCTKSGRADSAWSAGAGAGAELLLVEGPLDARSPTLSPDTAPLVLLVSPSCR
jgi:hypothetical protein